MISRTAYTDLRAIHYQKVAYCYECLCARTTSQCVSQREWVYSIGKFGQSFNWRLVNRVSTVCVHIFSFKETLPFLWDDSIGKQLKSFKLGPLSDQDGSLLARSKQSSKSLWTINQGNFFGTHSLLDIFKDSLVIIPYLRETKQWGTIHRRYAYFI